MWVMVIAFISVIVGISVVDLRGSYQKALRSAYTKADLNGHLVAEWVAESFYIIEYLLHDIANTVEETPEQVPLAVAPFANSFNQKLVRQAELDDNILLLGLNAVDGTLLYSSIESILGKSAKELDRDYYAMALQAPEDRFKVSNAFVSSTDQLNVTATYSVFTSEREFVGFALAGLDLTFFQRWLNRIQEPHVTISIIDESKTLLARKPVLSRVGQTVEISLLDEFMETKELAGQFRIVSPLDSTDRLWSIRRIRELPFLVAVGYSTDYALMDWRAKLYVYVMGIVLISVVSVLLALRYLGSIRLLMRLQIALSEIKTLSGLLPICSYCKKIRDDKGYWTQIEEYIKTHSEAEFSHGICNECMSEHFPDLVEALEDDENPNG